MWDVVRQRAWSIGKYSWQWAGGSGQHKDRGRRSEIRDRRTDDRRQKTRDRRQKKEEDGDSTVGAAFSRDRINFYDFNELNGFNEFYGSYDLRFTAYCSPFPS